MAPYIFDSLELLPFNDGVIEPLTNKFGLLS